MSRSCRSLSLAIAVLGLGSPALAQSAAEPAPNPVGSVMALQLEVFRNGVDLGLIAAFQRRPDGRFSSTAAELSAIGLTAPAMMGPIALDSLPGVSYRYDEVHQRIFIDAAPAVLAPTIISLRNQPTAVPVSRDTGALLNYSLSTDAGDLGPHSRFQFENVEGAFDARAFGPFGLVSSGFDIDAEPDAVHDIRLNTYWSWSDPVAVVTAQAGDFISGGFSWTRPVRLGGLQVLRDFGVRPDLITTPTPVLSATAAAPSTLDVLLGPSLVLSRPVPEGPVQVTDVPVLPGQGQASLVLRDALGGQHQVVVAYFSTPQLLRAGILDFSTEAGFARRNFGLISNDYDGAFVGSGSVRYGLSDTLTLQGHAEGGDGLADLGAGLVQALGAFGAVSLAAAGSDDDGRFGGLFALGVTAQYARLTASAQAQQIVGDYRDLAAVTQIKPPGSTDANLALPPKSLLQFAVSTPLGVNGFATTRNAPALALSYAQAREESGPVRSTISASLSYQLAGRLNLQAAVYASRGGQADNGFSLVVSVPLGRRITVTSGVDRSDGLADVYVEADKQERPDTGATAWRLRVDEQQSDTNLEAEGVYRASFGRVSGLASFVGGDSQIQGRLDGALVWLGAPMASPDRLDGAFATIDVGAPNVEVREQNVPIGVSDTRGWLLARNLTPYEANRIDLNVEALPLDLAADRTSVIVSPPYGAGALVRFGVAPAPAQARLTLMLENGRPAPAGALARLNGGPANIAVGYDGELFLANLNASNSIQIDLGGGASCTARFDIDPQSAVHLHVAQILCRSSAPTVLAGPDHSDVAGAGRMGAADQRPRRLRPVRRRSRTAASAPWTSWRAGARRARRRR